jgi:pimeloyl-ACP methyl ester carboxylesterase
MMSEEIQFLEINGTKIAHLYVPPKKHDVTIMFLHGFFSSMLKTKGKHLRDLCVEKGYGFLSLDYAGHGQSSGEFEDGCISQWLENCEDVIRFIGAKKLIIVGSSLGGWMMLHLMMRFPDLVSGLVGIAVAPDFTTEIPNKLTPQQYQMLKDIGKFVLSSDYQASGVAITQRLLDDGAKLTVFEKGGIPCHVPVRLLHGVKDVDCSFTLSLKLVEELNTSNIEVTLIKDGEHSLSTPQNLRLLSQVIIQLVEEIEENAAF